MARNIEGNKGASSSINIATSFNISANNLQQLKLYYIRILNQYLHLLALQSKSDL